MAWNLAAEGADIAKELEAALLAELKAVLSKAEYAVLGSSLHGETVSDGSVHSAPAAPAPEPVPAG